MYDQLPAKLKNQGHFCNWRPEERGGRMTKVPYQANGKHANPTDRRCFTDFETACRSLDGSNGIGIGIFDDIASIDIDHCVDMGVISDLALDIIETMGCYTEYSPSGNGIRILCTVSSLSYDKAKYFIQIHTFFPQTDVILLDVLGRLATPWRLATSPQTMTG